MHNHGVSDEGESDEGDHHHLHHGCHDCAKHACRPVDHFSMGLFDRPTAAPVQQKFCVEVRSDQLNQPEFASSPKKSRFLRAQRVFAKTRKRFCERAALETAT